MVGATARSVFVCAVGMAGSEQGSEDGQRGVYVTSEADEWGSWSQGKRIKYFQVYRWNPDESSKPTVRPSPPNLGMASGVLRLRSGVER